ncbi:MAG: hypothetical protein P8177_04975, partial [Gemmatimonadota bacterium]
MAATLDADARAALQHTVLELDGILYAGIDPRSGYLWVVRDPAFDQGPIELAIRNRIASMGHDPADVHVR